MRRFLTWYLPLAVGIAVSAVFAWGFAKGLGGSAGEVVRESAMASTTTGPEGGEAATPSAQEIEETLVVLLGDSLARGTGDELGEGIGGRLSEILDERGTEHEVANLAVNGATTEDLTAQLERPAVKRLISRSSVILVSIGGNDFFGERDGFGVAGSIPDDPSEVTGSIQGRLEEVVSTLRESNPEATIYILGLYNPFRGVPEGDRFTPLVAEWNAQLIGRFADDPGVVIVQTSDLFLAHDRLSADQFHPNGEAYGLIARRIADTL